MKLCLNMLNIPISTHFHVYFYLFYTYLCIFLTIFHVYLYLYLTYLDIFSCIFIPISMYISTYFYIFQLISTYLVLFSTCRALQLLLPASGTTTCLDPIPWSILV